ncbi:unnamed protein product, partial [Rotaria sordida]
MTVDQLKQIYDDFIQLSPSISTDHLINILHLLEDIDMIILTDPLIINHEFYSQLSNILEDLFTKWQENDYLTESESFLFDHITRR